jgi:arginase
LQPTAIHSKAENMKFEILGTPFNGLGFPPDIENPGNGLRQANLIHFLKLNGHSVIDHGDITGFQFQEIRNPNTGISNLDRWIDLSNSLSEKLEEILKRGSFPLILGGDCSLLVGIFSAFAKREENIGLIFLDGHADFHYPHTSPTGDPADMELAVLTGRGNEKIVNIAGKSPLLKENDVVVFGIRAYDQIADSDIPVYDSKRMKARGINNAVVDGLKDFSRRNLPLWLNFDVDVLDPEFIPVMFPEPGGLTFEEAQEFLNCVRASGQIIGMSITCYHPILDKDGSAGVQLVNLIASVFSSNG